MFPILNRIKLRINSALFHVTPTIHHDEVTLSNQIGNELQSVLRPLNLMQALYIGSMYKIRNNSVTTNSFIYNSVRVVFMIFFCFYGWFNMIVGFSEGVKEGNWSKMYNDCFYSIGFFLNYYSIITYRHQNVSLVNRIQHAIALLKVNSKELRCLKIYNWIAVLSINSIYIGTCIIMFVFFPGMGSFNILLGYSIIIFDINVMYASFIMKLLRKLLIVWTEDVRRAEPVSDSDRESYWKIKYDVYVDIMEAYKLIEKIFGWLVAYYTITTGSHALINIATLLLLRFIFLNGVLFGLVIFVSQVWFATSILIGISLTINCERFYEALTDVGDAVTPLMYTNRCSDKHTLSVCKNIQRLQKASFKKMSACGLFVVDAMMSLRLFTYVTTYTIVLIQFEFL